ncbi:MAG: hypothetical protein AMS22_06395 [Thiotrichales bacterium SG8_50]|jgi:hypothetical protein|nr:MAG: hypothetical protein AMS22_06395 [Thiotrichales bacterium SG8_50]
MPVEVQFKENPAGVLLIYTETVTGNDIMRANEQIADCEECTYQLSDFSGVTSVKVSPAEMHRIAIQDCSIPSHYKLEKAAMVGNKDKYARLIDLYYLFAEVWVGKQRQYETRTFSTIEEARQWIGI